MRRKITNEDKLKRNGYNVKYIWELDWKQFKKGTDKVPKILIHS